MAIQSINLKEQLKELDAEFDAWINKKKYRKNNKIKYFLRRRADIVDRFVLKLWYKNELQQDKYLGLFAVGGYGRQELHPYSDIDLLILSSKNLNDDSKKKLEGLIQNLWDEGLSVGHSVRTIKESYEQCKRDITAATNILESRLLFGQKEIKEDLEKIILDPNIWKGKKFLEAKIEEQEIRHKKYDNTEFNLEPNVKSSPGGLRDIQIISWLMLKYSTRTLKKKLQPEEVLSTSERSELIKSRNWIWIIRYLLHESSKREEDRLLFANQLNIGSKIFSGIKNDHEAAEKLMKKYYQAAFSISEINNTVVKSFREKILFSQNENSKSIGPKYIEKHNLIELKDKVSIKKNPYILLEIFYELCRNPHLHGIGPKTLRKLKENRNLIDKKFRENKKISNLFMQIIRSPRLMVTALEEMNRLGILGRYLPEFGKVIGQMQYDLFHIYTVDAHTIEVLRNMRRLNLKLSVENYPLASELIHTLPKLELLYIAGLFHDLGKGSGKDHSIEGAKTVVKFCKKHNLSHEETSIASWLVTNHLIMSTTSQKEDLSDPKIIANFANKVGNTMRLKYLYCLTVADITATNPSLWNNWKATLLRELYFKTRDSLTGQNLDLKEPQYIQLTKRRALEILKRNSPINEEDIKSIWENFYSSYFKNIDADILAWHSEEILNKSDKYSVVKIKLRSNTEIEETSQLMIFTKDRPNVFSSIVSILEKNDLQILDAKLHETKDKNCIDSLTISDSKGNHINNNLTLIKILEQDLTALLNSKDLKQQQISRRLPNKLKSFKKSTLIKVKHDMNNRWTQIDIETLDGPGKLMTISNIFSKHKASIVKARISTLGERVEDRFCIMSHQGTPFIKQAELNELIKELKVNLDAS